MCADRQTVNQRVISTHTTCVKTPILSIVIPTRNRPDLLFRAVQSALEQTLTEIEVIVVDDASTVPITPFGGTASHCLPPDPRLRVMRLPQSRGGAAARNIGTAAARGRWVAYLDDDDRLLPHMASVSLDALTQTHLPAPVAVISGIEVIDMQGQTIATRLPPRLRRRGDHFALEPLEAGRSYNTKQTLVVEKAVIEQIGGWDESFRSRVHSELFLRLNPVCSIVGLPTVTYQLCAHSGERVSSDRSLRQASFHRLIQKHRSAFEAHPAMFAHFVYEHALTSYRQGQRWAALTNLIWALQIDPLATAQKVKIRLWQTVFRYTQVAFKNA